jgi:hypothetical protein
MEPLIKSRAVATGSFSGWDTRSEPKRMVNPLREVRDKVDHPKSPVPPGCCPMRRLLRRAPNRRMNDDLRRTSHIHPHWAVQRKRVGLDQRFLSILGLPASVNGCLVSCRDCLPGRLIERGNQRGSLERATWGSTLCENGGLIMFSHHGMPIRLALQRAQGERINRASRVAFERRPVQNWSRFHE